MRMTQKDKTILKLIGIANFIVLYLVGVIVLNHINF